jgi:hypothetical protein
MADRGVTVSGGTGKKTWFGVGENDREPLEAILMSGGERENFLREYIWGDKSSIAPLLEKARGCSSVEDSRGRVCPGLLADFRMLSRLRPRNTRSKLCRIRFAFVAL